MMHTGRRFGKNIKSRLERLDRCKQNSKGFRRAKAALKQSIDVSAKKLVRSAVTLGCGVVVVENLKGITHKTKSSRRRRGKTMRRWIGRWNVQYWLKRVQAACEMNRIRFATVSPYKTSQTCPSCSHVDPMNRDGEAFLCLKCGFKAHADVVGATNVVSRFLTGKYGSGFKALCVVN